MKKIINFSSNQLIHTGAQTVIWQGQYLFLGLVFNWVGWLSVLKLCAQLPGLDVKLSCLIKVSPHFYGSPFFYVHRKSTEICS